MNTLAAAQLCTPKCAEWEGFRPYPYPDPASDLARASRSARWGWEPATAIIAGLPLSVRLLSGAPWTVGFGTTGAKVGPNTPQWSHGVAMANLEARLEECAETIAHRCTRALTTGQLAALASFLDNVGGGRAGAKDGLFVLRAGRPSTLWASVLAGDDHAAANQFLLWNKAQGRVLDGLTKRRMGERAMYLGIG